MPQIGMGIVLILAFIGIMNYINTFVANVQNRMTEFSIMESNWNDAKTASFDAYQGRDFVR